MKKHFGLFSLMLVVGILLLGMLPFGLLPRWRDQSQQREARAATLQPLPQVTTVQPQPGQNKQALRLPASLSGVHETTVYARADGYVRSYNVDIGDKVRQGQILAQLEAPELEESLAQAQAQIVSGQAAVQQSRTEVLRAQANVVQVQADIDGAKADIEQAQAERRQRDSDSQFASRSNQRWQALLKEEAVSLQEADMRASTYQGSVASLQASDQRIEASRSKLRSAQARLQAMRSEVATAQARVDSAQAQVGAYQAAARRIERQLEFLVVRSPLTGVVTERNIDAGSLVSAGTAKPVYKLASVDRLKVYVDVPQSSSAGVAPGLAAEVYLPGSTRTIKGKVIRTTNALDAKTRTLRTEIQVNNSQGLLAPGMAAEVNLQVPSGQPGWIIPAAALTIRPEGPRVVIIGSDQTLKVQPVQVGADLGKQVQIVDGLRGGEHLVLLPTDTMVDGQKVAVKS
jgi:RND family efflux transporter MFP subunit